MAVLEQQKAGENVLKLAADHPPTTPVLHLTDEEDVQTQDTQDQSQEF